MLSRATSRLVTRHAAVLPELPYQYHELEPYISADIMELHHSKHHQTYGQLFIIIYIQISFNFFENTLITTKNPMKHIDL